MRRVETGETYVGEVPLQLFRDDVFRQQVYLGKATELVFEGVRRLKVSKREPIHICTGYILSEAREALVKEGFIVEPKRITGETQALAEREFIGSLVMMGAGEEDDLSRIRSFNGLLGWVLMDLEGREGFVKTGWPSWKRLRERRARTDAP